MLGHPTDYDVERNKKSLRQRLLQQFVDDFRIRLATHSLHCLTNEKAEERFLAAAILLNFFGIGGQNIGDDLFDRPSIGRLLQALILDDLCRTVAALDRKSVVEGKSVSVRVAHGGCRIIQKKIHK